eukprot:gene13229-15541_t
MERESFENEDIAKVMNECFINIKVDREERPDIDKIYMTYITEISGSGGWPMSVWLTPSLEPVTGGTYFAPEAKYGRPGFPELCRKLALVWKDNRKMVQERGATFIEFLKEGRPLGNKSAAVSQATIDKCHDKLVDQFDEEFGGFSDAPKFPRTSIFNLLHMTHHKHEGTLEKLHFTLQKMAYGGMYDHLAGGFHRYSVTPDWKVPHFEKMLYDQGQIATVYLEAYQVSKRPLFAQVARGILDYVQKDLTHHAGGFYSAEDADSLRVHGGTEKMEGAFYVWDHSEIVRVLTKEDAEVFNYTYGIKPAGNVEPNEDPHGEFLEKNIVMRFHTSQEASAKLGITIEQVDAALARATPLLLAARANRPRPHLDDKIITAWNGLMISAFAKGSQVLGDAKYLESAKKAVSFIKENLYDAHNKTLIRNYREGPSSVQAFTDDYAFLIQALLDLYEATFDLSYFGWAIELQETQDALFWDEKDHGYFSTSGKDSLILCRLKEDHDGAEPSCQSVSCMNLLRFYNMLHDTKYQDRAIQTFGGSSLYLEKAPMVMPQMVCALSLHLNPVHSFCFVGSPHSDDTLALVQTVHSIYHPNKVILNFDPSDPASVEFYNHHDTSKITTQYHKIDDKSSVHVCSALGCLNPTNDPSKLIQMFDLIKSQDW